MLRLSLKFAAVNGRASRWATKKIFREPWGTGLLRQATLVFGSWNAGLRATGITPAKENSPWPHANKAAVLAEIRRRQRAGQTLFLRKVAREKWGDPLGRRCRILFGGWNATLRAAGVKLSQPETTSPWLCADKGVIIAELRRRQRAGESLRYKTIKKEEWGAAFLKRTIALFGSWTCALLAADVELPPKALSPWSVADASEIVKEIRRRKRKGESLLCYELRREKWGTTLQRRARKLFGSWENALLAAHVVSSGSGRRPQAGVATLKSLAAGPKRNVRLDRK